MVWGVGGGGCGVGAQMTWATAPLPLLVQHSGPCINNSVLLRTMKISTEFFHELCHSTSTYHTQKSHTQQHLAGRPKKCPQ